MSLKLHAKKSSKEGASKSVLFFVSRKGALSGLANTFDKANEGFIKKVIKGSNFNGDEKEILVIPSPQLGIPYVVLVGMGDGKIEPADFRNLGISLFKKLSNAGIETLQISADALKQDERSVFEALRNMAEGFKIGAYRFDTFKTEKKKEKILKEITFFYDKSAKLNAELSLLEALMDGQYLARDLVNLPPNISNPDYMEKEAKKLTKNGVKVKVLKEKDLQKKGLNLFLAVGRAATQESRMIIMKYMGDDRTKEARCVVGKGVMFDTGGYNLKPSAGLEHMKADMAGAAAVMGMMKALAKRKAKVNVIGVCGCVMNMVGGDGYLPSDILTSYSGKTVEIGNTDAEGRLVLADSMSYIIETEKPSEIIDIATLTGACMAALGGFYGGLFTPEENMATRLLASGQKTGERLWRLPLDKGYAAKTKVADLSNNGARWGGASTAAVFLQNFNGGLPWAHLDIAGVGMAEKIPGTAPIEGASGFGVRLLVDYLESKK